ncbi:MAG: hypothetical protein SWJ54_05310 [Cyanobacteriota bacterium]|nr:hypothetical protein [Cyanobacteriota bacterium]
MSEHRLNKSLIARSRHGTRISQKKLTGFKKELNQITQEASQDGLLRPYIVKSRLEYETKRFSATLGPLRRFLCSKVGQPWDLVYSELCQHLESNTQTGQYVLSDLWNFVERHVKLIDGIPYDKSDWRLSHPLYSYHRNRFYVHPETGILCLSPPCPQEPQQAEPKTENVVILDDFRQYHKVNGIWYLIKFKVFPYSSETVMDVLWGEEITERYAKTIQGQKFYAAKKRQCNKKEIKFILSQLQCTDD